MMTKHQHPSSSIRQNSEIHMAFGSISSLSQGIWCFLVFAYLKPRFLCHQFLNCLMHDFSLPISFICGQVVPKTCFDCTIMAVVQTKIRSNIFSVFLDCCLYYILDRLMNELDYSNCLFNQHGSWDNCLFK